MEYLRKIHEWLMEQHQYSLRPMKLLQNIVLFVVCVILFFTVYGFADSLNSEPILFLRLGSVVLLVLLVAGYHFGRGVFVGTKHAFRSSTNLIKILLLLLVLGVAVTAYHNQDNIKEFIDKQNKKNLIDKFNPFYLSDSIDTKTSILSNTPNSNKGLFDYIDEAQTSIKKSIEENNLNSAKDAFNYINQLRSQNGRNNIMWDDRIYNLSLFKLEDMQNRNYWDHKDPDGKCIGSYAGNFGLNYPANTFADNLYQVTGGSPTPRGAVDSWMTSEGHRYNLLYPDHQRGALACDYDNCTFIGQGFASDGTYWGCATGAEGLAYWASN